MALDVAEEDSREDRGDARWKLGVEADSKILSWETARLIVGIGSLIGSVETVVVVTKLSREGEFRRMGGDSIVSATVSNGRHVERDDLRLSCRRGIDDTLLAVVGGVGNPRKSLE